jgi:hypothetical protein
MAVMMANSITKATAKGTAKAYINSGVVVTMMTTTMAINQQWIIDYYLVGWSGRGE